MTAINTAVHEFSGVRLPLQPYTGHAVFMYSTASDGNVTLQLKEPDDLDRNSLAVMLARLQAEDSSFSIYTQDADMLSDGGIDVLLGNSAESSGADTVTASFDFFDSSSAHDLTLSPQTLSNTTEALINDNSNSLGLPADSDTVSTTTKDDGKPGTVSPEPKGKRPKTKPTSPNRQGPQQCTVCSKVFGNASALAKHKLTHSDERKYVCNVCNKAFKRQDHLNGHMLTHRNKKPYECKADGCGKSYCDARSLRRHTENHHVTQPPPPASSSSTTTMSPAQGAAAGDAASPHGSSCIQYAPPPVGSPGAARRSRETAKGGETKSQLQQLLSTEPAKSVGSSNDGLTKQQLDLIHQIMEQTQRQSHPAATVATPTPSPSSSKSASPKKSKSRSKDKTVAAASSTSWSPNSHQQQGVPVKTIATGAPSPQGKVTTTTPCTPSPTGQDKQPVLKPVECNLCKRRFKNIPALNGHMRLHGGYFKKDPDVKKTDKKEPSGPPLQTASSSVRALIEEKIISRRNASPANRTSATQVDFDQKLPSFVVPAPPAVPDKNRRHSDAEALAQPPAAAYRDAQAIADLIAKRERAAVKRTVSDPGGAQQQQQQQLIESFMMYQTDEGGAAPPFVAPGLEDDVFAAHNHIVLEAAAHLPFQPESLDDSLLEIKDEALLTIKDEEGLLDDIKHEAAEDLRELSLEDIATLQQPPPPINRELQAVLNSPLPESLAEFSAYHSTKGGGDGSPVIMMGDGSSPGFAYPTPPASHEAQSPCFGQALPLISPGDDFGQVVERGLDEPPQASSPLSAAFYTSTMSSSAEVEEAIQEVLPGETMMNEDNLYPLSDTPPSQSETESLGLTPVPSPRVAPSLSSPHPTYDPKPVTAAAQWGATTLMLPNSEDPLLSSQPKDFVPKRRVQLNGVPVRLLSNQGWIELNGGSFTGLLVDVNGELKLIQTGGGTGGGGTATAFTAKNFVLSNAQLVTTTSHEIGNKVKVQRLTLARAVPAAAKLTTNVVGRATKVEDRSAATAGGGGGDVFLSPTTLPTSSPARQPRKKLRTEPLQLPVIHQSKLRTTRSKPQGSTKYTPQPILNPQRPGAGLYANIKYKPGEDGSNWSDPIPESDSTPHINVDPQSQCVIPDYRPVAKRSSPEPVYENLLWDPGISACTDSEVEMYLEFACCAAIPGGGRNKEYAMHLLHMCSGNIHDAMLRLMQPSPQLPADHPLLAYSYSESDKWTSAETELFHRCLLRFDKDFVRIAEEIKSKSVKQCVQFYYVWKKVCSDEYNRIKATRQSKRNHRNVTDGDVKAYPDVKLLGIADSESPMRSFICEYPDCSASFNSRAALNGHIRIHGGTARNSPTPSTTSTDHHHQHHHHHHHHHASNRRANNNNNSNNATAATSYPSVSSTICHPDSTDQEYPCKICGKVFSKIKSRSAHMKSHRPPDAEPSKRRNGDHNNKEHNKEPKDSCRDLSSSSSASTSSSSNTTTSSCATFEPSVVPSPFSL